MHVLTCVKVFSVDSLGGILFSTKNLTGGGLKLMRANCLLEYLITQHIVIKHTYSGCLEEASQHRLVENTTKEKKVIESHNG